ncbi:MAG: peptidoglycan-binding protein [Silicimonas sp.]|nr:peptidoglycan-binding protein [Silicimonas sp.]
MQTALNGFDFPAGVADGVLGRKSRAAIRQYQSYVGFPVTGWLDTHQREILLGAWNRVQYGGGAAYPNMMAQEGPRGMLRTALNPEYPRQRWNDGRPVPAPGNVPIPSPAPKPGGQEITGGTGDGFVIPTPKPIDREPVSISARCDLVQLTRSATGGVLASNMTDPNQALSEKFCDARDFAIRTGANVHQQYAISENEIGNICTFLETAFRNEVLPQIGAPKDTVITTVTALRTKIGLGPADKAQIYGQICLGLGYRTDNADMALASALTLVTAGMAPVGELVGHHLREGFGLGRPNAPAAQAWYEEAVTALENGTPPVFEPSSTPERIMVIRKAIEMGGLRAGLSPIPQLVPAREEFRNAGQ